MLWGILRESRHWRQWDRPVRSSTCSRICLSEFRWGLTCLRHVFLRLAGEKEMSDTVHTAILAGTDQWNSHGWNRGNQCKKVRCFLWERRTMSLHSQPFTCGFIFWGCRFLCSIIMGQRFCVRWEIPSGRCCFW